MTALLFSSCEKDSTEVIDPNYDSPVIISTFISPDTVFTTSGSPRIQLSVFAQVQTTNPISSVTAKLYTANNEFLGTFNLQDNGSLPDSNGGDGVYSVGIDITNIQCLIVGNYRIEYLAEDNLGLFSNLVITSVPVINTANQPPVISGLYAPDTILVPSSGANVEVLSIFVNDPDGMCDISTAIFNAFAPNGTPSGNNPFSMFDDGNIEAHGDTVAGDGRYSEKIQITSAQSVFGYFTFKYTATDRSGLISNEIVDSILVKQP